MKKKFFGAVVVVAIAVGAMININLSKVSNKGDLAFANVEQLAQAEYCYAGGKGATQCSIEAGIVIAGYGISGGCSVTCGGTSFACCGLRCTCY